MSLKDIISKLKSADNYRLPTTEDAFRFLVSEVGEIADCLIRTGSNHYVRNNPDKSIDLSSELADVIIMAAALAASVDIDIDEALEEKLAVLLQRYS